MPSTIGVLAAEQIAVGLVEDHQLVGKLRVYPNKDDDTGLLSEMPAEEIIERIVQQIELLAVEQEIKAIGIGFPGVIRNGIVEDCPNLPQAKGQNLVASVSSLLRAKEINTFVHLLNDADALAAGIAATQGHLDKQVRVWYLGTGIGFGLYPAIEGAGEGGHMIVSLDPKEQFCRCGGRGHLEGIMGARAMRLRFLDLEPEEVFQHAKEGDERCSEFVKFWHRALAAATASSIHLNGPGRFYISGPYSRYVQTGLLNFFVHEMVKMSPLQGSVIEVVAAGRDVAVIGAGVSAAQAAMAVSE
ncbi:MAG TPA: ROK family protein [Blastocatellia bacterium]|nr:ROK family protein [Blastocatellia bacterium]